MTTRSPRGTIRVFFYQLKPVTAFSRSLDYPFAFIWLRLQNAIRQITSVSKGIRYIADIFHPWKAEFGSSLLKLIADKFELGYSICIVIKEYLLDQSLVSIEFLMHTSPAWRGARARCRSVCVFSHCSSYHDGSAVLQPQNVLRRRRD